MNTDIKPDFENRKIKCHCQCHTNPSIKHVVPCCENGWIEVPVLPETDHEVSEWLKTVDETMYDFSTKLQQAVLHDPGTKGKMLITKLLQPVFSTVKRLQEENEQLIKYHYAKTDDLMGELKSLREENESMLPSVIESDAFKFSAEISRLEEENKKLMHAFNNIYKIVEKAIKSK